MRIELLDTVTSTNDYIKRYLGGREDVIVCAREQTGGKGTKGRSFLSPLGGVYLSALTFYDSLPAAEAFRVMAHAAVAVCRTAEAFGAPAEIKWPNDVYACGRKLCGILIENGFSGNRVSYSIVGIGLNVVNDLSLLGGIAVNLSECAGRSVSVDAAREKLIENYRRESAFRDYLSYVRFLGRNISVTEGGRRYSAVARSVLADGRLEIEENGVRRALSAAEIGIGI